MTKPQKKKQLNKYLQLTGVAFQMGITIYLGVYFGKWLDEKYVVENSIFTIIFSLLGVFTALYYIIKQIQKLNKD